MEIVLPYPPSVNTYWRAVKGRVILSKKGREYRHAVNVAVASAFESEDSEVDERYTNPFANIFAGKDKGKKD